MRVNEEVVRDVLEEVFKGAKVYETEGSQHGVPCRECENEEGMREKFVQRAWTEILWWDVIVGVCEGCGSVYYYAVVDEEKVKGWEAFGRPFMV